MIARDFAELIADARQRGENWTGRCPAHEDTRPSLSWRDGDTGLVLHCHRGCTVEEICGTLKIPVSALFREPNGGRPGRDADPIIAAYDYVDQGGQLIFQVVRTAAKRFWQRRPGPDGAWVNGLGDAQRVLYHLDRLGGQHQVAIAEGERDVDRLWELGIPATCNPMGAGKWTPAHTQQLVASGVTAVVLFSDNDTAGQQHVDTIAASVITAGLEARRVQLPGLPPVQPKHGEDLSDWLDDGHSTEELHAAIAAAPRVDIDRTEQDQGITEPITGAGIGEILRADPVALQTTYIVTPWIPCASLNALSAKAGVGKGKLAQDLCIARATGGRWLGLSVAAGPALFWSGEQGGREDFRVTQALCRGRGLSDPREFRHFFEIIYDPAVRFGHPTMIAAVKQRLQARPGLFIVIDSQRRAFDGDESDSAAADAFYRTVLAPLRTAGATVLTLAHPPKTTGQQKSIPDENMIRGSGDWLAQLDSFMVLRPVNRERGGAGAETITTRLTHVKPRSGPQAAPLLVTMEVTGDLTPLVSFTLSASTASESAAADCAGAMKAAATLFEEKKRLSRTTVLESLQATDFGRPAVELAIKRLTQLGVIHGPLVKTEKQRGERGHWYLFVKPLEVSSNPAETPDEADEEPDED